MQVHYIKRAYWWNNKVRTSAIQVCPGCHVLPVPYCVYTLSCLGSRGHAQDGTRHSGQHQIIRYNQALQPLIAFASCLLSNLCSMIYLFFLWNWFRKNRVFFVLLLGWAEVLFMFVRGLIYIQRNHWVLFHLQEHGMPWWILDLSDITNVLLWF